MDPQVVVALINGTAAILSTVIAAIAAQAVGKIISKRNQVTEDLELAKADIVFLLAVEAEHCRHNRETYDESRKIRARDRVREAFPDLEWSGKFTIGRQRADRYYTHKSDISDEEARSD